MADVANTLPCVPAASTDMEAISTMMSVLYGKPKVIMGHTGIDGVNCSKNNTRQFNQKDMLKY